MTNNKGFSLVELIVVITIMGILTGTITLSYKLVTGSYVKECAYNTEFQLNKARQLTMGKSRVVLKIYRDSEGTYYSELITYDADQTTVLSTEKNKLGKKSVILKYSTDNSTYKTLEKSEAFSVEYDRASGAMKDKSNCVKEIIYSNGTKEKKIILYPDTGKLEVK